MPCGTWRICEGHDRKSDELSENQFQHRVLSFPQSVRSLFTIFPLYSYKSICTNPCQHFCDSSGLFSHPWYNAFTSWWVVNISQKLTVMCTLGGVLYQQKVNVKINSMSQWKDLILQRQKCCLYDVSKLTFKKNVQILILVKDKQIK